MSVSSSSCVARLPRGVAPRFVRIASWHLAAPVERVWALLMDVEGWPGWWPDLLAVHRLRAGAADGAGGLTEFVWRSRLGYRLCLVMETTRVAALREIEGRARGDLEGHGLWLLHETPSGAVQVTYRWDIRLERDWMRLLTPLLRPMFAWSHAAVMRRGARGMAAALGCEMQGFEEFASLPAWPPDHDGLAEP